jgi:two-component system nitrate/nitrite response regulator NarL
MAGGQPRRQSILVVDDDAAIRAQVRDAFGRLGYSTREAVDGLEAVSALKEHAPALIIAEVHLAGVSGYELCREVRDSYGDDVPLILVSADRTAPPDRVAGLLIGADDYLPKPFDPDELLARARRLLGPAGTESTLARLTDREREVLGLLLDGLTQKQIAEELVISPKTVGTHIQNVLIKLGVHSRAQAVALAHREGLSSADSQPSRR